MNSRGHAKTLVAEHPGNVNALKSGIHSPSLIEARASEIVDQEPDIDELDEAGRTAILERARIQAVIEAIDRDLGERGVSDRTGKERYQVRSRERYSRRLTELTDRVSDARTRARKHRAEDGSVPLPRERGDYVRAIQYLALGLDFDARPQDRVAANKLLFALEMQGMTPFERGEPRGSDLVQRELDSFSDEELPGQVVQILTPEKRAELEAIVFAACSKQPGTEPAGTAQPGEDTGAA